MPTSAMPAVTPCELVIAYVLVNSLIPAPRNARRHTKKQITKLTRAIRAFGFRVPILAKRDGTVVAGHARLEAVKLLGLETVPVIYIDDLSDEQIRLLAISENRLGDLSHFSIDDLKIEFGELAKLQLDLDLTLSGFDMGPIDLMIEDQDGREPEVVEPKLGKIDREQPAVTCEGDQWLISGHRIVCGSALDENVYNVLLDGERAQTVVCDPPYNLPVKGHVSSAQHHAEFAMASGEMTPAEFIAFLEGFIKLLREFSVDGSVHYIFMDFRHMMELLTAARDHYALLNLCVWAKSNAGMGSLYRSQHELVFVFKVGKASSINNVELGKHGRNRTNVWRYPGMSSFGKGRNEALAMHPTVKPVALVADAILDCSERGGIVLDAFLGSGTTLLAAEKTGRRGYGIELDPYYVDLAVERVAKACGVVAILAGSEETFDEVRDRRAAEARAEAPTNPDTGWGRIGA